MTVRRVDSDGTIVFFRYNPSLVQKMKRIEGREWHPDKKYCSVPYSESVIEKILEVCDGEKDHLDPIPKKGDLDSSASDNPTLAKGGKGGFSHKNKSSTVSGHDFEDLRRELVSRKLLRLRWKGGQHANSPQALNDVHMQISGARE